MPQRYLKPLVTDEKWCKRHRTHPAVCAAIHYVSDDKRSPEHIWAAPTKQERAAVKEMVRRYLSYEWFEPTEDNRYQWAGSYIEFEAKGISNAGDLSEDH